MTFLNYYVKIILAFIIIIKIIGNTLWSPCYKNGADQLLSPLVNVPVKSA